MLCYSYVIYCDPYSEVKFSIVGFVDVFYVAWFCFFYDTAEEPGEFWHPRLFYISYHTVIQFLIAQGRICTQCIPWHCRVNGPLYGFLLLRVSECNSISEPQHFTTTVTRSSPTVAFVEFSSGSQLESDVPEEKGEKKLENEMSGKVELVLSQKVKYTEDKSSKIQNELGFIWQPAATVALVQMKIYFLF